MGRTRFYSLLRESGSLTPSVFHSGCLPAFLFAVTRERVTDKVKGGDLQVTCFYSLLRESGSLTRPIRSTPSRWRFLFAVTRERLTDLTNSADDLIIPAGFLFAVTRERVTDSAGTGFATTRFAFLFAVTRERVTDGVAIAYVSSWLSLVSIRCYARAGH